MTPILRPVLGGLLTLAFLLAALPTAQADPEDVCAFLGCAPGSSSSSQQEECVYAETTYGLYVAVDPSCAGVQAPVLPGMESSCDERERHPTAEEPPCCDDGTPEPPCCGKYDPCCEEPGCCGYPSCCPYPGCCNVPACCRDLSCCQGDPGCLVRNLRALVRYRVGQDLPFGLGFCFDVGQKDDGTPYAALDTSRSCVRPPE